MFATGILVGESERAPGKKVSVRLSVIECRLYFVTAGDEISAQK